VVGAAEVAVVFPCGGVAAIARGGEGERLAEEDLVALVIGRSEAIDA
jgi:hypothetical protein